MKKILTIVLLGLCHFAFSQQQALKHHAVRRGGRVVTDKQYEQKIDTNFYSYEFFIGNSNSWNGENYSSSPSSQFLVTYDNNKNYEIGVFGCINQNAFKDGNADGIDFFFSHKLIRNFTMIIDNYSFLGNQDSLKTSFDYNSNFYNLTTARLKLDVGKRIDFILGYSIYNNRNLENSVSLEFDYTVTSDVTFVIAYSTHSIANLKDGSIGTGIGFLGRIATINDSPIRLGMSVNPIFDRTYTNADRDAIPFSIMLSMDI